MSKPGSKYDEANSVVFSPIMRKEDVAKYLQCSNRQVEILAKSGGIPKPFYVGGSGSHPRWKRSVLEDHINKLAEAAQHDGQADDSNVEK